MEDENQRITTLGKSLIVPNVQELVKEGNLEKVPNRYVQQNQDQPTLGGQDVNYDNLQVPIIDMENLVNGDDTELEKMHLACQEWGFFQLVNHGIQKSLVEKLKLETKQFFDLPLEEKKKYSQTSNDVEDIFMFTTLPIHMRRPHLLPMLPLPYRDTLENYSSELQKLTLQLLDSMSKALKIDPQILRGVFGDQGLQSLSPCPQPEKVIGLTPHSDATSLTILLQSNEVVGLQIQREGKWVYVNPLPDAFVVNIGDIIEIATNGIYRTVLHRAVVNATKERLSIAAFHMPALDGEIGPIHDLITPSFPAQFRRISVADYFKEFFARSLDEKSYLDAMRINKDES